MKRDEKLTHFCPLDGRVHHAGDFPEKSATAPDEPVVANPGVVAP